MTRSPALFASAFAPHVGGVEELVRQLAIEQRILGMTPTVFTNRYPKSLPSSDVVDGVPVRRVAFRVPGAHWRHLAGWTSHAAVTHLGVARDLRSAGSDLVHIQCVSSNAAYALRASRALSLPLVVTMQGELSMDASRVYETSAYLRRTWRRCLDAADLITGCSQFVLDEAEDAYGRSFDGRARVIYNGIRLAEYLRQQSAANDRPSILGIGRMVEQKGFDILIRAFAELATNWPDAVLTLAGDGGARPDLEDLVGRSGLQGRVVFTGRVTHRRALELFNQATAFVLPSRLEPQGIVLLEAMASGTPVVAANVGGVPEIVRHRKNGLLFPGGDVEAIARAVDEILADDQLRERLSESGRRTASAHDWSVTTARYLEVYEEATRNRGMNP